MTTASDTVGGMARSDRPGLTLDLPAELADAVDRHVATDWDRLDPSGDGVVRSLAQIGEAVVALWSAASRSYPPDRQVAAVSGRASPRPASQAEFDVSDEGPPSPTVASGDEPTVVEPARSIAVRPYLEAARPWVPSVGEVFEAQTELTGERWIRLRLLSWDPARAVGKVAGDSADPPPLATITQMRPARGDLASREIHWESSAIEDDIRRVLRAGSAGVDALLGAYGEALGATRVRALQAIARVDPHLGLDLARSEVDYATPRYARWAAVGVLGQLALQHPEVPEVRRGAAVALAALCRDPHDPIRHYARQILARLSGEG